jgi:glycolate oxidase iron-sulfur subunit
MHPGFDEHDPPSAALADACVHCGFCLPACPTYLLWNEEMDSPRGRIHLMKAALEGRAAVSGSFVRHVDACLGCMACVTACPSGVRYGPLIEKTRGQVERRHRRALGDRLFRAALFRILPRPAVLRLLLMPMALARPLLCGVAHTRLVGALPAGLQALVTLAVTPRLSLLSLVSRLPRRTPAVGPPRLRVGVLTGCVQRIVFPEVNRATVRVLSAEGCEVISPAQGCCGALSRHAGRLDEARSFACRTIEAFEAAAVDVVVVNAAGCGSSMKEYGELLAGDPVWGERGAAFGARVRDVSELLTELGTPRATRHPVDARVAYHDACHLAHAQGVRRQPRDVLGSIPGLTVLELAESEICCGSAGIYNLVQPEAASTLGDRKARHVASIGPDLVATGNPGCGLQLAAACDRAGMRLEIVHPVELLDRSIRGSATGQISADVPRRSPPGRPGRATAASVPSAKATNR